MKIVSFQKKKTIQLTIGQKEPCEMAKTCYICKRNLDKKYTNDSNYRKVQDHFYYNGKCRGAVHSICNLKYIKPT